MSTRNRIDRLFEEELDPQALFAQVSAWLNTVMQKKRGGLRKATHIGVERGWGSRDGVVLINSGPAKFARNVAPNMYQERVQVPSLGISRDWDRDVLKNVLTAAAEPYGLRVHLMRDAGR
jgi:hypothetical protein